MFQDFFLPAPKRARNSRSSANPCTPTIHVTVNTGPSASTGPSGASPGASCANEVTPSPPCRSPLGTITVASANAANINIPTSLYRSNSFIVDGKENTIDSSDAICYPSVIEILQSIDNSGVFEGSAELTFPAVIFADALQQDYEVSANVWFS